VRSTTTGISAFIDPWGRVQATTPLFKEAVLHHEITAQHVSTLYQRWGDLFAYVCVTFSAAVVLWTTWPAATQKPSPFP
jgi:apolipoprotein N-acyltransferase